MMGIAPPGAHILEAKHPVLAIGPVADRRSLLILPVGITGIEPVITLAAFHIGVQIGGIINRRIERRVQVLAAIAPVRQRHIPVNADKIHIGIGPERVQVIEHVARAVLWLIAKIFRPVGSIGELGRWQYAAHLGGQLLQMRNSGEGAAVIAQGGQPAQFRANQEGIHAARQGAQRGIVQDKAPE